MYKMCGIVASDFRARAVARRALVEVEDAARRDPTGPDQLPSFVTLNLFQGPSLLSRDLCPGAGWMLKQVQHDGWGELPANPVSPGPPNVTARREPITFLRAFPLSPWNLCKEREP